MTSRYPQPTLPEGLITTTIERFVSPVSAVTEIMLLPIQSGSSGAALSRIRVGYVTPNGDARVTQLILKNASSIEREMLTRLQNMPARHVPFNCSLDHEGSGPALVCMQDLGERFWPHSLASISPSLLRREAEALADIHVPNLAVDDLAWLPSVDRGYFEGTIERDFFRPAWNNALRSAQFVDRFGALIGPVEMAAETIIEDMMVLNSDVATRTLTHTDLNPSNVLVFNDMPYIIDWGTAHVGSFYLDLPHHLSTLDQAEVYRIAMERRGYALDPTAFARSYAIAARYTGLRYLWWTLAAWQEDQTMDEWVMHYVNMILRCPPSLSLSGTMVFATIPVPPLSNLSKASSCRTICLRNSTSSRFPLLQACRSGSDMIPTLTS